MILRGFSKYLKNGHLRTKTAWDIADASPNFESIETTHDDVG